MNGGLLHSRLDILPSPIWVKCFEGRGELRTKTGPSGFSVGKWLVVFPWKGYDGLLYSRILGLSAPCFVADVELDTARGQVDAYLITQASDDALRPAAANWLPGSCRASVVTAMKRPFANGTTA